MGTQRLRALMALIRLVGSHLAASWHSWGFPVRMGVLYSFLWGIGYGFQWLIGNTITSDRIFESDPLTLVIGWLLLSLTLFAFLKPRHGALCSTFVIAWVRVIESVHPFNIMGIVFWILILHGMYTEIDAPLELSLSAERPAMVNANALA